MVPFGLSSAAAVRVGQAVGRRDAPACGARAGRRSGSSLVAAVVIVAALRLSCPTPFLRLFTADPAVLGVGVTVLLICAVFQPFDGFQAVATGALRGLGDTRTPMLFNLVGHWLVGLPARATRCVSGAAGASSGSGRACRSV